MHLNKAMILAFREIIQGADTFSKLEEKLQKSQNWVSSIVTQLEKEGFVEKKRNGVTIHLQLSDRDYAIKFKDMIIQKPTIKYYEILDRTKLLLLAAMSQDWITLKGACELSNVSYHTAVRYYKKLLYRGVIKREGRIYKINEKVWPDLLAFLLSYKNYAQSIGRVLWKYQDEILFLVHKEELVSGKVTGLYAYKDSGVRVGVINAVCYKPKRKLSKEEIFIHSLFEVEDPRTLSLALTFYVKHRLKKEKVLEIAMRYGKYSFLKKILSLLGTKEKYVTLEGIPTFDRKDFIRIAHMYEVNNVFNT